MAQAASVDQEYMFRRPLAIGAAGGSFSSLALHFLSEAFGESSIDRALFDPVPTCNLDLSSRDLPIDPRSVLIGIVIGLALGPLLEVVFLIRQWWTGAVRRRLLSLVRGGAPLYRVL